jgi:putative ABC transport system substrate-binding protein
MTQSGHEQRPAFLDPKCDILCEPDGVLGAGEAMRRRDFIAFVGGTAAAWPLAARAQQSAMPVIGFLSFALPDGYRPMTAAFRQALQDAGFIDGQNVAIEYHWAEENVERLPALAADLVKRKVTVIAAVTTEAALAAKAATTNIPIVFETGGDPVRLGLVASLNRPGGNITGVTQLTMGLVPKALEVMHELLPAAKVIAFLVNPGDPALSERGMKQALESAEALGLKLQVVNATSERDLEGAFDQLSQLQAGGLVICPDPLFTGLAEQIGALSVRRGVPAAYKGREFAEGGGLLAYGTSITDAYRLAGVFTARILKGDKPADLPVQQSTKVELYINLKTAKALGITVPLPLSGRADEVFE